MSAQDILRALQGGLIQQDRLLKVDTPLGPDVLLPQRAAGLSQIGRHYDFTLDVLSTRSDQAEDPDSRRQQRSTTG
ncbi:type VI secretion protein ImpA [Burkholderia aenigmatica]|uniref:Type VI secretion protein ImpA n=1 Tax=Burkholderia aenigmatica TaxID=2015348 RepID=A0A6J5JEJ2_9BURK|nr:type VI secretion protein ImpA [Burkholderia aenigmatica]VWC97879.1 type VI secretion protein ImpA [Burkholderia aenigmatica]